jgi:hypothetical protein
MKKITLNLIGQKTGYSMFINGGSRPLLLNNLIGVLIFDAV